MSSVSSPARSTAPPGGAARPAAALAVIVTCQLMIGLDSTVVLIALPKIHAAPGMHFGAAGLAWVQNAYMLAFGGLLLLGGRAGDLFGRRRAFMCGVAVFVAASLCGGLATSPAVLLAARTAQGASAALAGPSVMALIATNFVGQARARALAVYSAVTGAGGAIGMFVGGVLTDLASWRSVFFVNIPIGLAVLLLTPRFVREAERHRGRLDVAGALLSTAGMTALVYGFIRAASAGWSDPPALGSLGAAVLLLALFVLTEARVGHPLLPLSLLADRVRAVAYTTQFLLTATLFGTWFFLTQFLQDVMKYTPLWTGLALVPTMAAQFLWVRAMPRLIERHGTRPLMLIGACCIAAGLAWLSRLSPTSPYALGVLPPLLLLGTGGGICFMPLNLTVLRDVRPEQTGAASGFAQAMLWTGGALGSAVLVSVAATSDRSYHSAHPHISTAALTTHGMTLAYGVATAVALAAVAFIYAAVRPPR